MATATAAKKKLVVCGGNGFLGSRIVKSAVTRGWSVTSISRSGEPTWSSVTSSPGAPSWSKSVTWHAANILHPSEYAHVLEDTDAVVHSMGILLEADYKGVLTGKESVFSGLSRAFSASKQGSHDPLSASGDVEPLEKDGQITYELMNRDSGTSTLLTRPVLTRQRSCWPSKQRPTAPRPLSTSPPRTEPSCSRHGT